MVDSILKCNPGNIRTGQPWVGLAPVQDDTGFCTFTDAAHGIRAMMLILHSYAKQGLNTVQEIVGRWAPSSENDTSSYVKDVAGRLGVAATDNLVYPGRGSPDKPAMGKDFSQDKGTAVNLCKAIIHHEIGKQPYAEATFNKAWELAEIK